MIACKTCKKNMTECVCLKASHLCAHGLEYGLCRHDCLPPTSKDASTDEADVALTLAGSELARVIALGEAAEAVKGVCAHGDLAARRIYELGDRPLPLGAKGCEIATDVLIGDMRAIMWCGRTGEHHEHGEWVWRPERGMVPVYPGPAAPPAELRCVDCQGPFDGVMYGAGDGTGQRFRCQTCHDKAHPAPEGGWPAAAGRFAGDLTMAERALARLLKHLGPGGYIPGAGKAATEYAQDVLAKLQAGRPAAPAPAEPAAVFKVGERVEKYTGDFQLEGEVRAAFTTRAGKVRYVVEHQPGFLHVYGEGNLRAAPPPKRERRCNSDCCHEEGYCDAEMRPSLLDELKLTPQQIADALREAGIDEDAAYERMRTRFKERHGIDLPLSTSSKKES